MMSIEEKQCGNLHIPTLFLCGGTLLPFSSRFAGISELLREKIAIGGVFVLLIYYLYSVVRGKRYTLSKDKIFKTFVFLCIAEIVVSVMQLLGVFPSFHQFFRFTGTFTNPSVLALMMSLCLPICLFYFMHADGNKRDKWLFLSCLLFIWIVLTESRTSVIAVLCSSFIILMKKSPSLCKPLFTKRILIPLVLLFIVVLVLLYYYKLVITNN